MRIVAAFAIIVSSLAWTPSATADDKPIPTPKLNRVDYRRPDAQKGLGDDLGFGKRSQSILRQLKPKDRLMKTANAF